jgi:hypothetical protein
MKKRIITMILLFTLFVTACSASIPTETRPAAQPKDASSEQARPTPTNTNSEAESVNPAVPYPGNPPTAIPASEDYPAPQQIIPTQNPYPEDEKTVWILHPVGIQCEDAEASKYQNEQEVVSGLKAAGLTVHHVATIELMVCTACGCPTSAHFRAEINASDLEKAIDLGWEPE